MPSSNIKFKLLSLFIIISASILGAQSSYAQCGSNINEGIQKIIDAKRIKYQIPGIQVSISCPGETQPRDFVSGTTTIDGLIPVNSSNLFQIGSETKSFIAAIILQLEAEGWLSIHDPIGKYLLNIPDTWKTITIQQLLNHTSGLFNYTEADDLLEILKISDFKKQLSAEELVNYVLNKTPYFNPGLGWHYSNTNYVLAGMVIQVVTGKSVEDEINTRLLTPLQLSNTYYLPRIYTEDILQRMAHGYSAAGEFPDEPRDVTDFNMSWANAAGAIVSTSHDSAIWLRQLLTTNSVLPAIQRQELMEVVDTENGQALPPTDTKPGYGLGVALDPSGGGIWGHSGGTMGYLSNMYWLKCNDVVITTIINRTNKDGAGNDELLIDLITFIQKSDTSNHCDVNQRRKLHSIQ